MRSVKHDEVLRPYTIADNGIVVFSSESVIGREADVFSRQRCSILGEE